MSPPLPIIIVGAGLSGLTFANGLLNVNIPFKIFERDPAVNNRSQGYRVRVNSFGQEALKQTLSPELFSRVLSTCAYTTSSGPNPAAPGANLDGVTGLEIEPLKQAPSQQSTSEKAPALPSDGVVPLNVDRTVLRSVLVKNLESYIVWGKEFESYVTSPTSVLVKFKDGEQLVPEYILLDTEGRLIFGKTVLTPELTSTFNENALRGLTCVQHKAGDVPLTLLVEPMRFKDGQYRKELPVDYVYWVLATRKDSFGMDDEKLLKLSSEEVVALSQKLTTDWHASFKPLFKLQGATQTSILRICSSEPEIQPWKTQERVTIIGDAAHTMSPTAVLGAVTALRDAALLVKVLLERGISEDSIGLYEESMRDYAGQAIKLSRMGGKWMFKMPDFEQMKHLVT